MTYKDSEGQHHRLRLPINYARPGKGNPPLTNPFTIALPDKLRNGLAIERVTGPTEKDVVAQVQAIAAESHKRSARERWAIVVEAEEPYSYGRKEDRQKATLTLSYRVLAYQEWVDELGNVLRAERATCTRDADTGVWEPGGFSSYSTRYEKQTEVPYTPEAVARLDTLLAQMRTLRAAIQAQVADAPSVLALVDGRAALALPAHGDEQ